MPNISPPRKPAHRKKHRAGRKVRERYERAIARNLAASAEQPQVHTETTLSEPSLEIKLPDSVGKQNSVLVSQNSQFESLDDVIHWIENYLETSSFQ